MCINTLKFWWSCGGEGGYILKLYAIRRNYKDNIYPGDSIILYREVTIVTLISNDTMNEVVDLCTIYSFVIVHIECSIIFKDDELASKRCYRSIRM